MFNGNAGEVLCFDANGKLQWRLPAECENVRVRDAGVADLSVWSQGKEVECWAPLDNGEYEDCTVRREREQGWQRYQAAKLADEKRKDECRAEGCWVVNPRRSPVSFITLEYRPFDPYAYGPPTWRCLCAKNGAHYYKEVSP